MFELISSGIHSTLNISLWPARDILGSSINAKSRSICSLLNKLALMDNCLFSFLRNVALLASLLLLLHLTTATTSIEAWSILQRVLGKKLRQAIQDLLLLVRFMVIFSVLINHGSHSPFRRNYSYLCGIKWHFPQWTCRVNKKQRP